MNILKYFRQLFCSHEWTYKWISKDAWGEPICIKCDKQGDEDYPL